MNLINTLQMYFQYAFVWRALIVGVLIALCSSFLGVTLVLKRFSHIGDGLSHVAFGFMCIAAIIHLSNDMILIIPATLVCAIILLRSGENAKFKGDASLAMFSVSSLAISYLMMNVFSESANVSGDVCTTLFGSTSILTLSKDQVLLSIILALTVTTIYFVLYNKIFVITFDENFASAIGINVRKYNFLIATVIALVVVLAMKLVGSLLVTALIIFPAISSMCIFKNYRMVIIFSVIVSIFCSILGILVAIVYGTPVGSTIVAINLIIYLLCRLLGALKNGCR